MVLGLIDHRFRENLLKETISRKNNHHAGNVGGPHPVQGESIEFSPPLLKSNVIEGAKNLLTHPVLEIRNYP